MIAAALGPGGALSGMADYRQFLIYKIVPGTPKARKLPCSPYTGQPCDAHDQTQWCSANEAIAAAEAWGMPGQVAFVFSEQDPFWFLDIDGAYANGQWSQIATELCARFAGAAVEVSTSGTGLHIFGSMSAPMAHGCKNTQWNLEFYTSKRFVALTGLNAIGSITGRDWAPEVNLTVSQLFPPVAASAANAEFTSGPVPEWDGPADDDELIRRMLAAKPSSAASFGKTATPAQLWEGDLTSFNGDHSAADFALAGHLAWWTGHDGERIERLMRRSALVREKWDTHPTYLRELTIARAIALGKASTRGVYKQRQSPAPTAQSGPTPVGAPVPRTSAQMQSFGGLRYMEINEQLEYFKDCIYVKERDEVLTPNGTLLNSTRFNATYAGYIFKLDEANGKVTNRAWEAFVLSLAFNKPIVDYIYFDPNDPPRHIREKFGMRHVNIWVPMPGDAVEGDVTLFLNHVKKLLPDVDDQRILLSYMAACVQYPGVKFQWAVALQGTEGNGKSMLGRILSYAVGGEYTYTPRPRSLDGKFNGWMFKMLLILVDDMKVKPEDQEAMLEALKPMITEPEAEIEGKGIDGRKRPVFCNYFFTTNHKDGLRKTKNDRRYCIFFTDQQNAQDLQIQGMDAQYFLTLRKWLENGGYAACAHYLKNLSIPDELNPATHCHRAPFTSSAQMAIDASLSGSAQIIQEAIAEGTPGLQGTYLSSIVMRKVLWDHGLKAIGPKAISKIVEEMGYIKHPMLPGGRPSKTFAWDNHMRSCIYVLRDSLSLKLPTMDHVIRDYETKQHVNPSPREPSAVVAFRQPE